MKNNIFNKNSFQPKKLGYVIPLDGLRAIAVIMVMFMHAHFQLGKNGSLGVDIFFALSGFLITTLLLEEYHQTNTISLRNFYIKRTFRLFPALYIMLLAIVIYSSFFIKDVYMKGQIMYEVLSSGLYLNNLSRIWLWGDNGVLLAHTWSLAVEEQFYLFWPLILVLVLHFFSLKKLYIGLMLFIPFIWFLKIYYQNPYIMALFHESLLIGCLFAILRWNGKLYSYISKNTTLIVFVILLVIGIFPVPGYWELYNFNGRGIAGIFTMVIILGLVENPNSILGRVLSTKILVNIGKISYALYLWHVPVFKLFSLHSTLPSSIAFIAKFFVTLILATLSYVLIEKRAIVFGRKLVKKADFKNIDANLKICEKEYGA